MNSLAADLEPPHPLNMPLPYVSARPVVVLGLFFCSSVLTLLGDGGARQDFGPSQQDQLHPSPLGTVSLDGILGEQIRRSIAVQLKLQDGRELLRPFSERRDTKEWRSEFWGKWITAAIAAWQYNQDPALRSCIEESVKGLLATQTEDGYIGAYPDGGRLQRWDLWGRKYVLLGLLAWHDATGDQAALAAARRSADLIISEVGPGGRSPFTNDMWQGMASSSIIEPMVLLHFRTGDARYLAFAEHIVSRWPSADGPDLLNKALRNTPVFQMFPGPAAARAKYGDMGRSKAYEMMSCFEGLAELYRSTQDKRYLQALKNVYANIRDTEITIIGSGSDWERWNDGTRRQTMSWTKGMETCVTVTWIKLAGQLLRLTGDAECFDQIERATFNALLSAAEPDGGWWCHHTPLAGTKERAPRQCGMNQNCCVANGPRALMALPRLAVMHSHDGPVVNLYSPSQSTMPLQNGGSVRMIQDTRYPFDDTIRLRLIPDQPRSFTLSLRIPSWSKTYSLHVNGRDYPHTVEKGYAKLERTWNPDDMVELRLDLRPRITPAPGDPGFIAVERGPLVLARDRRLHNSDLETSVSLEPGMPITLQVMAPIAGIAQVYRIAEQDLLLCDFASAGNTWTGDSAYRVWLPVKPSPGNKFPK